MRKNKETQYLIKVYLKKKVKPICFSTSKKETFDQIFSEINKAWIKISDVILQTSEIRYIIITEE